MSSKFLGLALAMTLSVPHAQAQSDPCGSAPDKGEVVTVLQATQRATMADLRPELATAEVRTARTERAIAALHPADTVSLEIEDFPGTGIAGNIDSLQVTGSLSRVWERGGKREAREVVANTAVSVARTRFAAAKYAIREEVETLYAEAALAERRAALACDRVTLSSDLETAIEKRVDAARDPLLAGARASSDRLQAQADARRDSVQARNLRAALGAYWLAEGDFQIDPSFLNERLEPREVDFSQLYAPELDRLEAQRVRSSAQIELERSQAIPDVTWSVGIRKSGIEDDLAVVGGASIPLGSANRSKASVTRARADQRRIDIERDVLKQQLFRRAVSYQRSAASALEGIEEIDTVLLPAATEAVDLARDGYARGAFSYLDIFDAQRTVAILREDRLTHLRTYILNEAALARLTLPVDLPVTRMETPE